MLRSLYIQNYALIEKLDISFSSGFWVPSVCCWDSVPM